MVSHAMVLMSLPTTPPAILPETISRTVGSGLQFNVNGQVKKTLVIQSSSDPLNWNTLMIKTNMLGTVALSDLEPAQQQRYYRAVPLP
jgi:hypothetical protein